MKKFQILIILFLALFFSAFDYKSIDSLKKSCENNNSSACVSLGIIYEYELMDTLQLRFEKAKTMYQKACDLKDKQACKYLKSLLEKRYLFAREVVDKHGFVYYGFVYSNDDKNFIIKPQFIDVMYLSDEIIAARFDEKNDYKWGLINQKVKMFISPQFDDVKPIENNFNRQDFFTIEKDGKMGLMDKNANILIKPVQFTKLDTSWIEHNLIIAYANYFEGDLDGENEDEFWLIDIKGKLLSKLKFNYFANCKTGLKLREASNLKWNFVSLENGVFISKIKFDDIKCLSNNFIVGKFQEKWSLIDKKGNQIAKAQFDKIYDESKITDFFDDTFIIVQNHDKFNLIDYEGKLVDEFDEIGDIYKNLLSVKKNRKWNFIDKNAKVLKNEELLHFSTQELKDSNGSASNKIVSKFNENLGEYSEILGIIAFKSNKGWYFIDKKGKPILPYFYDEFLGYAGKCMMIAQNKNFNLINKKGEVVTKNYCYE